MIMTDNVLLHQTSNMVAKLVASRADRFQSGYYDTQISHRYLIEFPNGKTVETSAYEHTLDGLPVDLSIDVSTMVGCPVGCYFCESGSVGALEMLAKNEIHRQFEEMVVQHDRPEIPQVVCSFQGIGEPSFLARQVLDISRCIRNSDSRNAISISTTGANIQAFSLWRKSHVHFENIQISMVSPYDEVRRQAIRSPLPLGKLIDEGKRCLESGAFDKVKFNLVLMNGVNDSQRDVDEIVRLFGGSGLTLKLSALNETRIGIKNGLFPTSLARAKEIAEELSSREIDCYLFGAFNDIDLSCGQVIFPEARSGQ